MDRPLRVLRAMAAAVVIALAIAGVVFTVLTGAEIGIWP